jgi:dTMP kinase
MRAGWFITIEGGEGAGKTTAMRAVETVLREAGLDVETTREPGGTPLGEEIRTILLDTRWSGMHADTKLLLMFAARAEHVHRRIRPALAAGRWVVSDRFTDATYAYQGGGRGIDARRIEALERWALGAFRPHRTLLLDLPAEIGLARARERGAPDRFEREARDFFERVRAAYLERARREPGRFVRIDAAPDVETVAARVRAVVGRWVEAWRGG